MGRTRSLAPYLFLALAAGAGAPLHGVELVIHRVSVEGGEVEFRHTFSQSLDRSAVDTSRLSCSGGTPNVCVALNQISANEYRQFDYSFYAFAGGPEVTQLRFTASSTGNFVDHIEKVRFDLRTGSGPAISDTLPAPVYSTSQQTELLGLARRGINKAALNGVTILPIYLKSLAKDLDIILIDKPEVSCDQAFWSSCSGRFTNVHKTSGAELVLPNSSALPAVEVRATPVSLKALTTSLVPFRPVAAAGHDADAGDGLPGEGVHGHVEVTLRYRSRGGIERLFTCDLPVRIVPTIWSLLIAVVVGALLGSLIPLVVGRRPSGRDWAKAAGAAALVGLVTEALAMIMVSLDSEVRLLHFTLDPFQILPASVMGALVGLGGFRSARLLKLLKDREPGG